MRSCCFRSGQMHKIHSYESGLTLLGCLTPTYMFNKVASETGLPELRCVFRCDQTHGICSYNFGHSLLSSLILTSIFIRGRYVEHLSLTCVAEQSVIRLIAMVVVNLVTPTAENNCKHLFNKLTSEVDLLNI
jgi:hypothetical protein